MPRVKYMANLNYDGRALTFIWPFWLRTFIRLFILVIMPRETVILECTEARKEGKPPSRYLSSRNKKLQTEAVEKKKYNPFLRRRTVHREIKKT